MRTKLHAAGLPAVLAIVLLASGGAGHRAGGPRLDELHPVRPVAARAVVQDHVDLQRYLAVVEAAHLEAYLNTVAAVQFAAAAEAVAAERAAAERAATDQGQSGGSTGTGGFLACTRRIESHGDYGAVSSGGTYRGAYQFQQSTWDSTAASAGRPDLVGRDPATVAPGDQDAMATHLYDGGNGASHWNGRCQ